MSVDGDLVASHNVRAKSLWQYEDGRGTADRVNREILHPTTSIEML